MAKHNRFSIIAGNKVKRIRNRFGESGHRFQLAYDENHRRCLREALIGNDAHLQLLDNVEEHGSECNSNPHFVCDAYGTRLGYIAAGNCFVML